MESLDTHPPEVLHPYEIQIIHHVASASLHDQLPFLVVHLLEEPLKAAGTVRNPHRIDQYPDIAGFILASNTPKYSLVCHTNIILVSMNSGVSIALFLIQ